MIKTFDNLIQNFRQFWGKLQAYEKFKREKCHFTWRVRQADRNEFWKHYEFSKMTFLQCCVLKFFG